MGLIIPPMLEAKATPNTRLYEMKLLASCVRRKGSITEYIRTGAATLEMNMDRTMARAMDPSRIVETRSRQARIT